MSGDRVGSSFSSTNCGASSTPTSDPGMTAKVALVQAPSWPSLLEVVPSHALLRLLLEGHVGHHDHHLDAQLGWGLSLAKGEGDGFAGGQWGMGFLVEGAAAVAVMKPAARA